MDESWRNFALILGAGGYGAAVGCVFGAVTGAVHWGSGRAAGTAIAHRVAAAFENAGDRELSRHTRGAIIGGLDGFLFLGSVGTLVGVLFAYVLRPEGAFLVFLAFTGMLLALAAACFGLLAYAIVRNGVWAVIGSVVGGVTGAFVAAALHGANDFFYGVVPGLVAGTLASFLLRRYQPQYREVRAVKPAHDRWRLDDKFTVEGDAQAVQDEPPPLDPRIR